MRLEPGRAVTAPATPPSGNAAAAAAPANPRVSVVVPTCGRPVLLARCVEALLQQTLDPAQWELVIVDDGHGEETAAFFETLRARTRGRGPAVRYLRPDAPPRSGPAGARNRGWRVARGAVIAFTDDDTVPDRDWLRQGLYAMGAGPPAVRGKVEVPVPGRLTDHGRMTQGLAGAEFVTANCFVRRDVLQQLGGFDERFRRAWREDSDLHFKLLRAYGEVPAAPLAVVQHPVRDAGWGVSCKQQANAMYDALLYKKHPQLYRAKVGRLHAPPAYYGIVLGSVAFVASLLAGWALAAALAFMAVLGLGARFAVRRLDGTARDARHVAEMLATSFAIPFLALYWRLRGAWRFRVPFF
jgi:hypothetical protein